MSQLVVFDWDGTLMDSTAGIVEAVQAAAVSVGLPPPPAAEIRAGIGLGLAEGLRRAVPDLVGERRAAFIQAFERRFARSEARLFPGVRGVLEELRAAGYRLGVATGASRRALDHHLESSGTSEIFDATICVDEALSKPHPQMLERLMAHLDATPTATVMVGDTVFDLEMARNAGVQGLGVTWGAHPPERLASLASAGLVERVDALPEAVARALRAA